MPHASTVAGHKLTIRKARRAFSDWKCKHPHERLELESVAHVTKIDAQHYDIIVIADAALSVERVRGIVRGVWVRAGGVFQSLVERCPEEVCRELSYTFKTRTTPARTRLGKELTPHDPGMLPENNGVPVRWGTTRFSRGRKLVWAGLVAGWFPEDEDKPPPDLPDPDRQDELILHAVLPRNPDDALSMSTVAHRAGMSIDRTHRILQTLRGAERLEGYQNRINAYWLRVPGALAVHGSVRCTGSNRSSICVGTSPSPTSPSAGTGAAAGAEAARGSEGVPGAACGGASLASTPAPATPQGPLPIRLPPRV